MNAKEAYAKSIESDLDRIYKAIETEVVLGRNEVMYNSNTPFKKEVLDSLREDEYGVIQYAPTPINRNDSFHAAKEYVYVLGITWYKS